MAAAKLWCALNGARIYLGKYGSPKSHERYRKLVAEWLVRGAQGGAINVVADRAQAPHRVALAYWKHADQYYRDTAGETTGHHHQIRFALRRLDRLDGETTSQ